MGCLLFVFVVFLFGVCLLEAICLRVLCDFVYEVSSSWVVDLMSALLDFGFVSCLRLV